MSLRIVIVFFLALCSALTQDHAFLRVVSTNTARPDGNGNFNINSWAGPAFDGTRVVFTTIGANASLWLYDLPTSQFRKLADTNTPAPGGTGNFTDFGSLSWRPLLGTDRVVFLAADQKAARPNLGLYSVPFSGGPITRLLNYNTTSPSGGTFAQIDGVATSPAGHLSVSGNRLAFAAVNSDGGQGVYTVNLDGTGLTRIADRNIVFPLPPPALRGVDLWSSPALSNNSLVFYGQTITDPSTGYNGIYTLPPTGGGTPSELFNSLRALPGNANANFHTRLRTPPLLLDGQTIAFVADDPRQPADRRFRGLFTMPLSGGPLTPVANIDSTLPGIGQLTPSSFETFSLHNGQIAFRASGPFKEGYSSGEQSIHLWNNGLFTNLISVGDNLDGRLVRNLGPLSLQALHNTGNNNRVAFLMDFAAFPGPSLSVYVALPRSSTALAALQNAASYTANALSPGGIVTLYGVDLGPAALSTFALDSNSRIPTALEGVRVLFNGEPGPLLYVSANQLSAIVPYNLGNLSAVDVVVQYRDRVSSPLRVPLRAVEPGIFSLDRSGTGQGAILNQDASVNGPANPAAPDSVVVIFASGFGATNPASVAGEITSSTNLPRLAANVTATIAGQNAQVLYAGPAPGAIAGLYQCNLRVPANLPPGEHPIRLSVGGIPTQEGLTLRVGSR